MRKHWNKREQYRRRLEVGHATGTSNRAVDRSGALVRHLSMSFSHPLVSRNLVCAVNFLVEANQINRLHRWFITQEAVCLSYSNSCSGLGGITVHATADSGESDRLHGLRTRER
jgi:hypothetical protein